MRRSFSLFACVCSVVAFAAGRLSAADSVEGQFLHDVRQVTSGYVRAGEGYFAPDEKKIIFQAVTKDYPFYQIYLEDFPGGTPKLVSTGRGRTTCAAFAPDGKYIIFASSHLDPNLAETESAERAKQAEDARTGRHRRYEWSFDVHMEIFRADLDGTNLHQLTHSAGYDAEGSFSPDGKQIVFCSKRDGDPELYIMDADGSNVRRLTNTPGYDGGPFFSPDGQWVVFRSDRAKTDYLQIFVIRTDGTHETPLTGFGPGPNGPQSVNWAPYWHPKEPYLIWTGADHRDPMARPNYDLWLMRFERSGETIKPGPTWRVTDNPTADVLPVFTPDGKRLMWTSNRTADHSSQLWFADFTLPKSP